MAGRLGTGRGGGCGRKLAPCGGAPAPPSGRLRESSLVVIQALAGLPIKYGPTDNPEGPPRPRNAAPPFLITLGPPSSHSFCFVQGSKASSSSFPAILLEFVPESPAPVSPGPASPIQKRAPITPRATTRLVPAVQPELPTPLKRRRSALNRRVLTAARVKYEPSGAVNPERPRSSPHRGRSGGCQRSEVAAAEAINRRERDRESAVKRKTGRRAEEGGSRRIRKAS